MNIKVALIGIGNMGTSHAKTIFEGKVTGLELTCICDTSEKRLEWAKSEFGDSIKRFSNSDELFKNAQLFDAVIIATQHYDHPTLAITALEHNKHVLIEKPAGVYTKDVLKMNELAKKVDRKFCIMYNQRTNPLYQKVRDLVKSGELGDLKRMVWIITNWYRSQSYHNSSSWRSTWEGEGGGVLLNQDPHQLDLWQWICGMPSKIHAFGSFGKYYDIEVEDDVTAYAEYDNGMTATFITSTGEAPGTNRLEISGTKGKVVVENDELTFFRNRVDEREFNATFKNGFGQPECWECKIPITGKNTQHTGILQNFANAIIKDEQLLAPGIEGILGLTISNAIHLSVWTQKTITLPLDEDLYYNILMDKIKNSTFKKTSDESNVLDVKGTH